MSEFDCPVTGDLCPIGENLEVLEKITRKQGDSRYEACQALKRLIFLKRDAANCSGVYDQVHEGSGKIIAYHCGTDDLPKIARLASVIGYEFHLEPELYVGIGARKPNARTE